MVIGYGSPIRGKLRVVGLRFRLINKWEVALQRIENPASGGTASPPGDRLGVVTQDLIHRVDGVARAGRNASFQQQEVATDTRHYVDRRLGGFEVIENPVTVNDIEAAQLQQPIG